MRIFTLVANSASLGLFIAGCSGDHTVGSTSSGTSSVGSTSTGTGGGNVSAVTIDTFCSTFFTAYCNATQACTPDDLDCQCYPGADSSSMFDFCYPSYIRTALEKSLQTRTTIFDQAQFDNCLARLKSLSTSGPACAEPPQALRWTTCLGAFQGQLAPGESCGDWGPYFGDYAALACKDGTCDNGVCVAYLKLGDACPLSWAPLLPANMYCNYRKEEWCHGVPGTGGAGGGDGGTDAMGFCAPAGELGDPCHPKNRGGECKSLTCDEATNKCTPPAAGQACSHFPG